MAFLPFQTLDNLRLISVLLVVSDVLFIPTNLLALSLVAHITSNQEIKIRKTGTMGEDSLT